MRGHGVPRRGICVVEWLRDAPGLDVVLLQLCFSCRATTSFIWRTRNSSSSFQHRDCSRPRRYNVVRMVANRTRQIEIDIRCAEMPYLSAPEATTTYLEANSAAAWGWKRLRGVGMRSLVRSCARETIENRGGPA